MYSPQSLQRKVTLRAPKASTRASHGMGTIGRFQNAIEGQGQAIVQSSVAVGSAFTPIRYAHVNRSDHCDRSSAILVKQYAFSIFWAYRAMSQMRAKGGLSWHDVMVLPGVRRAVEHMEDLAQLCHTGAARRYHPYCHTIRQEHSEYS